MQISKNFRLSEFLVTSTGIKNTPTDKEIENMKILAVKILQPLRDYMNRPIIITSGYRSYEVNKAVGGSKTSQHMRGEAVDITAGTRTLNKIMYEFIRDNCEWDQLINECDYQWIHVSYRENNNRKQELVIK